MIEYPAMIYKNSRSKTYVANCMVKNLVGFGKSEEDAIKNLVESLQNSEHCSDICITPIYGLPMAQ